MPSGNSAGFRRYLKAKATYLGHENGQLFWEPFAPVGRPAASIPWRRPGYPCDRHGQIQPRDGHLSPALLTMPGSIPLPKLARWAAPSLLFPPKEPYPQTLTAPTAP